MTIGELVETAWQTAEEKGWHEKPRSPAELIALMHSELSEALEEVREDRFGMYMVGQKPEGAIVEFADCIIRICDAAGGLGLDLEAAIEAKLAYNKTRSYRHGGKVL